MLMNQKEIAAAFQVSTRSIRDWEAQGMPSVGEGRKRKYALPECTAWRVERALASALGGASHDVPPRHESEARLSHARATLLELELAEREGTLLPAEVVEETWGRVLDLLRTRILNLPGRWGPVLVGLDSPRAVLAALQPLVRELLEDLSERVPAQLEAEEEGPVHA